MTDATWSSSAVIAYVLWAVSAVLITLDFFTDQHFGPIGVFICTMACTAHIRGYIFELSERDRNAFDLGRDSVRNLR